MKPTWILKEQSATRRRKIREDLIDRLLAIRGIAGEEGKSRFLAPDFTRDLHDPFLMRGMTQVVARIKKAMKQKERVGIFGDYDADGVCGSSVLYSVFKKVGMNPLVETYLPHREKEGYGLSLSGISHFAEKKVSLVITNDCGITNHKEILFAKERGIEVIVTDHHELSQGPPPVAAFLDPKRPDETYPFRELAGTGVAFKLAQALKQSLGNPNLSEAWEKRLLDLVAIATVADMMPLIDENRVFVKYGLMVLANTHRKGLLALMREAKLDPATITARDLGFAIGPRINATSRIDHASRALQLFLSEDEKEVDELAKSIERLNKRRRSMVDAIVRDMKTKLVRKAKHIREKQIVFASDPDWQPGILSLVSNRLREDYVFPTIMVSKGKQFSIGSCRAQAPFSLVKTMEAINAAHPSLFVRWGGHHQAAGFTVASKDLAKARAAFEEITQKTVFSREEPAIEIDAEVEADELTIDAYGRIRELQPFGRANQEPIFCLRAARLVSLKHVGNGQNHLRMILEKDGSTFESIFFNGSRHDRQPREGDLVDVVFNLALSSWNLHTRVDLRVIDFDVT